MANNDVQSQLLNRGDNVLEQSEGRTIAQLMWRRFRKNRIGVAGGIIVLLMLTGALIAPFLATQDISEQSSLHILAPPQKIYFRDDDGRLSRPFVYNQIKARDPDTLAITYTDDFSKKYYIRLFVRGHDYRLLWIIPSNLHLLGVDDGGRWNFWGTDTLGRDLYSRILYGAQVSLSVPFVGTFLTLLIGSVIGLISGFIGGRVDHYLQRFIEVLLALPSLPLWLSLAAAIPFTWPSGYRYLLIVVILSVIDWGGLARVVRGKVLQYRGEDYIAAAQMSGVGMKRMIFRHLVPGTLSHLIVQASLAIPGIILAESSLSFLGVGITPPMTSWGLLLGDAQKIEVLVDHQWLIIPGLFIVVAVLAFNFFGDGVRDAADPYS